MGIRVNDPSVLNALIERLPYGWQTKTYPFVYQLYSVLVGGTGANERIKRFHILYSGSTRVVRTMNLTEVLDAFEESVHFDVGWLSRKYLFVHAATLEWHGQAIVILGPPSSGRTTLLEEFIRCGATYCSDRYAVIDSEGMLHSYPSALYRKSPEGERMQRVLPEQLGWRKDSKPLPIKGVLLTHFVPGATWRPRRLNAAEALVQMLPYVVTARTQPQAAMEILEKFTPGAISLKGKRGDAGKVVSAFSKYL